MTWTTHYEDQDIRVMVSDEIPDVRLFINRMPSVPNSPWDEVYNGSRRLVELWGRAAEALTGQRAELLEALRGLIEFPNVWMNDPDGKVRAACLAEAQAKARAAIAKATPAAGD